MSTFSRIQIAAAPYHGVLRFASVGVLNTLIDFGIYVGLREAGVAILLANICSTSTAITISFFLNRHYTFKAHGAQLRRQISRFIPVTVAGGWVVQPLVIYGILAVERWLELAEDTESLAYTLIPKVLATVVTLAWNYLWYKHYVFATPRTNS